MFDRIIVRKNLTELGESGPVAKGVDNESEGSWLKLDYGLGRA